MSKTIIRNPLFSPFWLFWWSAVLSISWIVPNHYYPWLAFHVDTWTSISLLMAAAVVIWRPAKPVPIHGFALFWVILLLIPGLQTLFGLIALTGVAWITTAYIAGFCLALLVGAQWESHQAGQLGDGLFLAIGIAALVSVGLQLQQWLQIDGIELWKMGGGAGRPHANFGQPNQLGTFLLWGLLAVGWGVVRRQIGGLAALLMCAFLLFGLALTASRTAWIGLAMVVAGSWIWRRLWPNPRLPFIVTSLGLYFVVCIAAQAWLGGVLIDDAHIPPEYLDPSSGEIRLSAWAVFVDAILQRPWFGYGWYQVVPAQMSVAAEHPSLHGVFTSTHNLFLDLFIWCGIPLGLLISYSLLVWGWRMVRAICSPEEVILVLLLAVVANHALLELPLHYAYFLLPVGLVMGVLNARLSKAPVFFMPRWLAIGAWLIVTLLLVLIIRDYARIEASHENFRMERMHIKVARLEPPDVLLLTQWRAFIDVTRLEPGEGMSAEEIDKMRNVANFFAGPLFINKLAAALALNQQADEARLWLIRLCKSAPVQDCTDAQTLWKRKSLKYPAIAAIPWPTGDDEESIKAVNRPLN
jgi:O-antigen ligase